MEELAKALGVPCSERLVEALTHRSFAHERDGHESRPVDPVDNERLEFLGDSVVGVVVSTLLWEEFPAASEGEFTRRRADLVCERSLAAIAEAAGVGAALRLGRGEERSGGRNKPRLLASALEAVVGAVYLDVGFEGAMALGRRLFLGHVTRRPPGSHDYKSRIQEHAQALGMPTPRYEVVDKRGPDHDRVFTVALLIGDREVTRASGPSKVRASQAAAEDAMVHWGVYFDGDVQG